MRAAALLLLAGCARRADSPGARDKGPSVEAEPGPGLGGVAEPDTDCANALGTVLPAAGAEHGRREPLEAWFSRVLPDAVFTLQDNDGADVPGESAWDDAILRFRPDAPLAPSSDYTATLTWCDGAAQEVVPFHTSAYGTPTDGCDPADRAWILALDEGRVAELSSITPYVLGDLDPRPVLGLVADDAGGRSARVGWTRGTGGAQDYCTATTELPVARWEDPLLITAPTDLVMPGEDVLLSGLVLEADVAADCESLGGVRLLAQLDARHMGRTWTGELDDPDGICEVLDSFGAPCGPCRSDGAIYCLELEIIEATGPTATASLDCVAEDDCHPLCPLNGATCDAAAVPPCGG
jgi:hypothetical protein